METLNDYLRVNWELLQYAAFFGALVLLGFLEVVAGRSPRPPRRKRRWPVNYGLTVLNLLVFGAMPVSGLFVADYAESNDIGLLNLIELGLLPALAIGLLLRALVSWAVHLAMHKIPYFWRVHRVHHTDQYLDISTTLRFHPAEFLITTPLVLTSLLALGVSPLAVIVYELLDALMAVFTHSNLKLPRRVERVIRWLLVTPDMHRIHHSVHQPETDSNYGATLSIWDRLFGTYREAEPAQLALMALGLKEYPENESSSLWRLLLLPFSSARGSNRAEP